MPWGKFSWVSLGPLIVEKETMKALNYPNIISNQLHPYMGSAFPTDNEVFQQDNA